MSSSTKQYSKVSLWTKTLSTTTTTNEKTPWTGRNNCVEGNCFIFIYIGWWRPLAIFYYNLMFIYHDNRQTNLPSTKKRIVPEWINIPSKFCLVLSAFVSKNINIYFWKATENRTETFLYHENFTRNIFYVFWDKVFPFIFIIFFGVKEVL